MVALTSVTRAADMPAAIPTKERMYSTVPFATWDGAYVESSTCGGGTACHGARFVPPGRYFARLCATPGTLCYDSNTPETADVSGCS